MEGKDMAAATEGKGKTAARLKATVGGGDGEMRRNGTEAWRAFMSEFRPVYKDKHPSAKGSTVTKAGKLKWKAMPVEEKDRFYLEKAAEEQNRETTQAPHANKESNISNTSNTGEDVVPNKRKGLPPNSELYRHLGSGMGNFVIVDIERRHFEFAD